MGKKSQFSLAYPLEKARPRRSTSGTGEGANHIYPITSHQDVEHWIDVVISMINVFTIYVYVLLDPR